MKTSFLQLFCTIFCLMLSVGIFVCSADASDNITVQPPRILLISPFNVSFVQDHQLSSGFLDTLNLSGTSYALDRFDLELHDGRPSPEKSAEFSDVLKQIAAGKYKIIVCFGLPSLNLLKEHLAALPAAANVIICGISNFDRSLIPDDPRFTGVIQNFDLACDFRLIQSLFPETKHVILLTNWSKTGKHISAEARKTIRKFPGLNLVEFDNQTVPTKEMLEKVHAAKPGSVVLFQGWYNKNAVNAASLQLLMDALGNNPDIPLFVMHNAMLRFGSVGGSVESGKYEGEQTAKLTLRLLAGEKHLPFLEVSPKIILNESMLRSYRIPDTSLPDNALILGREQSFCQRYRFEIWAVTGIGLAILLAAVLCFIFAVIHRSFSRRMKLIFRNLPVHVAVVDANENVLLSYTKTDPHGNIIRKLADLPSEIYPLTKNVIRDVLRTGETRHEEYELAGKRRAGDFIPLPEKIHGRSAVLCVSSDIDAIYRKSEDMKLLYQCLAAVMPDSNTNASFSTILKTFCEHFHGTRCYILRYDYKQKQIQMLDEYAADGTPGILSATLPLPLPDNEKWQEKLMARTPVMYDVENSTDLDVDKGVWADSLRKQGVKTLCTMPVFINGELWGNWGMSFEREKGTLDEEALALIPAIGNMIELLLLRHIYVSNLSVALDQAQEATRAKSSFLATMSHELRTPLNSVIGFSELLATEKLSPKESAEYISGINLSGKALLSLINDILDLSKVEAGQMRIVPGPTDVRQVFRELDAVFRQAVSAKNLSLEFVASPELPLLKLDELRVRQILLNLIGNAVKYTFKGGIVVSAAYESKTLRLSVADTGLGIEKSVQPKIFEPFIQQDAVRDSKVFKGTGLGLAIVKKLAERMHGEVSLKSEPGKGSTFTITLNDIPCAAVHAENMANAEEQMPDKNLRILLIDDVALNLKVLSAMFKKLGYTNLQTADSANDAIAVLQSNPPDIVFSDLWMPGMTGGELAMLIQTQLHLSQIKVVAVTADIECKATPENGFNAVLQKPVTLEQLREVLAHV